LALIVIDTCAILKYALDEAGADGVAEIFDRIEKRKDTAAIPATVLTELFAILAKRNLARLAAEIEEFIVATGIEIVPVSRDMAVLAGFLKAKYASAKKGFSYNDAIILALAIEYDGKICTYDSEFDRVTEVTIFQPSSSTSE